MATKDKFKKMQQQGGGGTLASFQDIANTVAAVERQQVGEASNVIPSQMGGTTVGMQQKNEYAYEGITRFMRLPNPQIPVREYNMVSAYCNSLANMTRQDWIELAIIEKLHNDHQMSDEEFNSRKSEIRNRPPRGQRKGMKAIRNGNI